MGNFLMYSSERDRGWFWNHVNSSMPGGNKTYVRNTSTYYLSLPPGIIKSLMEYFIVREKSLMRVIFTRRRFLFLVVFLSGNRCCRQKFE